ncbi:MAG: Asp-tRNA(Asn)/Glu-tRNA(Gln) amidotransferase subunit GatB [Gammaproteobacteria bacterium]|nr:Asp-tRNA(Asn)/Glu-tRNA(Gln) amidotransferase subunit GatB [Gammaproteobacteria bacterium]
MAWETVIGLEVHVQLATRTKLFSPVSTAYGAEPNTQAGMIDLAMPGVLPVLNQRAVELAARFALAIGAEIDRHSVFARKNYFYPDLPKGYQISQYERPIVQQGHLDILLESGEIKRIGVTRAHLEEDAGKSLHEDFHGLTGVDLNRAGTPLLEIVSEPDMRSAAEAVAYMKKLHSLVRYIGISDGNMQEGSFRCDANVSVRPLGETRLGTRTELKNINSFRFVERAIIIEAERQIDLLEGGGQVIQQTRLFDPDADETRPMRTKEEANDYRYFPDPDLLPVTVSDAVIEAARAALPELPEARRSRFVEALGLSAYDADVLTESRALADYFETALAAVPGDAKLAANWVMGEVLAGLNRAALEINACPVSAEALGGLLRRIQDGTLSGKLAKTVFEAIWDGEGDADTIIDVRGLRQVTDEGAILALVEQVVNEHPEQVAQYQGGAQKVLGFFVGQVMKLSKGKANPGQVNALLRKRLDS